MRLAAALIWCVACGSDPTARTAGDAGVSPSAFVDAGATNDDGCTDAARLVYVVSAQDGLYSFAPQTLTFTSIGPLRCAAGGAHPFSMAVDRAGVAWVNYHNGALFKVSTKDASCTPTAYVPQGGFKTFGMGFATDVAGASSETLFICGYDLTSSPQGRGLGRLNLGTLTATLIGDFPSPFTQRCGELTGTGDARLFAFFEGNPAQLAALDKTAAKVGEVRTLPGVYTSEQSAYAFSFWGGDFWFYTAQGESPSQVTRYRAATDGNVSVVVPNVGFSIVGAGVSTCAPTRPIK